MKTHHSYFIVGIIATIMLWISLWELHSILIPKGTNGVIAHIFIVMFAIGVLFWLGNKNPKIIGCP